MSLIRFCPLCQQADDAPRHAIYGDDPSVARHMDCCREAGCPDGSCPVVTKGAEDLRNDELRAHLTNPEVVAAYQEELAALAPPTAAQLPSPSSPIVLEGASA